jgi:hypothetical protein
MATMQEDAAAVHRVRMAMFVVYAAAVLAAGTVAASERTAPDHWPQSALNSPAMQAMLRADRDKDGTLSREELEEYDLTLGRRFADADWDQNGRLSLYEFESLLMPPSASLGATR